MKDLDDESVLRELDPAISGISSNTIKSIIKAWHESGNALPAVKPDLPEEDAELLKLHINECLKDMGGEITRHAKIVHLAMIYIKLSALGKEKFLKILAYDFDLDIQYLNESIHRFQSSINEEEQVNQELALREALIPPRVKLLRQLITLPNGFIFLKDLRCDLLPLLKSSPRLKKLSDEIKELLTTYFDINLLDLKEITWNSPASLLERLMEYEAVHEITSWKDLKHRLLTDHRVFAFFHNKMPSEPLIFVEVALVKGMSDNIQKLLDVNAKSEDPYQADTAIFYSISSTQKGLEGISFGNFLIKRVVKMLSAEFENLKTFATLSPVPLFRNWLTTYINQGNDPMLKILEKEDIFTFTGQDNAGQGLLKLLENENWYQDPNLTKLIKLPLMRLCAHYLFKIKRDKELTAYDPVANFHLSNGAKIEHIHWLADISKKGMRQSAGIMLNYHYRIDKIAINHENYMANGEIHASSEAREWLTA